MYTLTKMSVPGWDEEFQTLEELRDKLYDNVCSACFNEESRIINPDNGEVLMTLPADSDPENLFTINRAEYEQMSVGDQINELLSSGCGAEFMVCETTEAVLRFLR